jgi:hypothetical protein
MKLLSKEQSMLNPSKTKYHKECTGNADTSIGFYLTLKLSLVNKFVTNWRNSVFRTP